MKIAIVTDIHHGKPQHTKRGDTALQEMTRFCDFVRGETPDLVLDLGDRITDADHATDLKLTQEVADAFGSISVPTYHVSGNHDLYHLSATENAAILGQSEASEVVDLGDWQLLVWRADAKITWSEAFRGFALPEPDLLWLSHQIAGAQKPTLVVSHVPVSSHAQTGNYYFQENPALAGYPESPRVRAALAQAKVPVVCLAGHVHWNTVTQVDGIAHLTQQSLTESFTTGGEPAGAMGSLVLGQDVYWRVAGRDPFECRLNPGANRWTPPLAAFTKKRPIQPNGDVRSTGGGE